MSVVYFIQCGPGGPIKIGVARNVKKRMAQLQTGQPYTLELLATMPGNVTVEQRLHLKLRAHRMSGEWFEPHENVLAEVRRAQPVEEAVAVEEDRLATPEEMDRSWRIVFIGLLKNAKLAESAAACAASLPMSSRNC